MKRHALSVVMCFAAAVISGTIFVAALLHEYALVEVAASVITGLQVFFLSSALFPLNLEGKAAATASQVTHGWRLARGG